MKTRLAADWRLTGGWAPHTMHRHWLQLPRRLPARLWRIPVRPSSLTSVLNLSGNLNNNASKQQLLTRSTPTRLAKTYLEKTYLEKTYLEKKPTGLRSNFLPD